MKASLKIPVRPSREAPVDDDFRLFLVVRVQKKKKKKTYRI
jgi:hypothetical protein